MLNIRQAATNKTPRMDRRQRAVSRFVCNTLTNREIFVAFISSAGRSSSHQNRTRRIGIDDEEWPRTRAGTRQNRWNATSENDLKVARYETLTKRRECWRRVLHRFETKPDGKCVVNQDGDLSNKIVARGA